MVTKVQKVRRNKNLADQTETLKLNASWNNLHMKLMDLLPQSNMWYILEVLSLMVLAKFYINPHYCIHPSPSGMGQECIPSPSIGFAGIGLFTTCRVSISFPHFGPKLVMAIQSMAKTINKTSTSSIYFWLPAMSPFHRRVWTYENLSSHKINMVNDKSFNFLNYFVSFLMLLCAL
jgi:hypothetical protein